MGSYMQIPEKVGYILEKLKENHFEGYVVGGCVRDSILGRLPGDWDITTSAKPEEVKKNIPEDSGYRSRTWYSYGSD